MELTDRQGTARRVLTGVTDAWQRMQIVVRAGLALELLADMECGTEGFTFVFHDHIDGPLVPEDDSDRLRLCIAQKDGKGQFFVAFAGFADAVNLLPRFVEENRIAGIVIGMASSLIEAGADVNYATLEAVRRFSGMRSTIRREVELAAFRTAFTIGHRVNVTELLPEDRQGDVARSAPLAEWFQPARSWLTEQIEVTQAAINTMVCEVLRDDRTYQGDPVDAFHKVVALTAIYHGNNKWLRTALENHAGILLDLHFRCCRKGSVHRVDHLATLVSLGLFGACGTGRPLPKDIEEVLISRIAEGKVTFVWEHLLFFNRELGINPHDSGHIWLFQRGFARAVEQGNYGVAAALAHNYGIGLIASAEERMRVTDMALVMDQRIALDSAMAYVHPPPNWRS